MEYGWNIGVNAGLSTKNPTLTLLGDLTVFAQEDIFYCGVKDETHILQKALLDEKRLIFITVVTVSDMFLATLFQRYPFFIQFKHALSISLAQLTHKHTQT